MATPRIFVSSTCYDLQEVRGQLRGFIESFGYLPVMSEYGDIFYDYQKHTQDACKDEITKCQLFVLIIGNSYGSIYYRERRSDGVPDSVTLQELRKALEIDIYKHIFINKFVDYDYKNYKRALESHITNYFDKHDVSKEALEAKLIELKREFNGLYIFPQPSYSYIFNFLDIVYELKSNNAVTTYESFDDIKESLKRQWAGFVYDSIAKSKSVSIDVINSFSEKIDRIENQIKTLAEGQISSNKVGTQKTFDVTKLAVQLNSDEFQNLKDRLHTDMTELLFGNSKSGILIRQRVVLNEYMTEDLFLQWFETLEKKLSIYRWSKEITTTNLFKKIGVKYKYYKDIEDIPYSAVANFYNTIVHVKKEFSAEDFTSLISYIVSKFNELYEEDKKTEKVEDLPF